MPPPVSRSSRPIFSLTGLDDFVGLDATGGLDGSAVASNLCNGDDCTSAFPLDPAIAVNGVTSGPCFEVARLPSVAAGVISPPVQEMLVFFASGVSTSSVLLFFTLVCTVLSRL
jgi:hypothetical protein